MLLYEMDRPARNRKTVNYSDFLDDDDEDFATVKGPPNKKARASVKDPHHESNRETPSNSPKAMDAKIGKGPKERLSLDEKLHKRDLEAALSLSLLQSMEKVEEPLTNALDEKCQPPVLTHCSMDGSCLDDTSSYHLLPRDSPPVLSNCSVDVNCLGLDHVTSEQTPSRQKTSKTRQPRKRVLQDENDSAGDEDYKPQNTPGTQSDADFSDPDESEDEEFSVKKKGEKKKTSRNEKKKIAKKERNTPKLPKATQKSAVSKTAVSRSPGVTQAVPAQKTSPITPPMPKHALCSSPAGGRLPKWNPPGLVGNSPTSCQSAPVKSPGLGLRLGLSRLARVKPLHSNAAAH
ncbi:RAD51-associated protein 1 isoform X1 [Pygocentrus nattereri]|uniref:RAD51-associated protein 1 isoform X1 n=1 Tax=Pygocentrus nattereri TaxID=42514 RepID=UPI0018913B12|nr:RAD51-associated protein 1 isoform X1 [Pygocentrus nattereri]